MADFFDSIIANAGDAPRAVTLPSSYRSPVETFEEGCRKCRGTGEWRPGFPCFACKGKGKLSFKTSATARAAGAASRESRRVKTKEENIASFAALHPDVAAWLDGNSLYFAVSLRVDVAKYGSLTDSQLDAARRCIDKRNASIAARVASVAAAPVIDIAKIERSFETAIANGLKRPKLRIAGFSFSLAPATGRNAGAIYVKRNGDYLGKVQASKLVCVSSVAAETKNEILAIAADPAKAAVAHGMATGTCSCCGAGLTNKISIERGIGPICAAKYGW